MDELDRLYKRREKIQRQVDLFEGKWKNDDTVWRQMLDRINEEIAALELVTADNQGEDLYKE